MGCGSSNQPGDEIVETAPAEAADAPAQQPAGASEAKSVEQPAASQQPAAAVTQQPATASQEAAAVKKVPEHMPMGR